MDALALNLHVSSLFLCGSFRILMSDNLVGDSGLSHAASIAAVHAVSHSAAAEVRFRSSCRLLLAACWTLAKTADNHSNDVVPKIVHQDF